MASAATVRADFNGDGRSDLAVGVRGEGVGSGFENVPVAGAVNVLYGSASGLSANGDQLWHQNSPGVLETAEAYEEFGHQLAAGDFNGDGRADLAVSVDDHLDVGSVVEAGAVNVLYGSASGLSASGDQFWHQNSPGILDAVEDGDGFGADLAAGDLNGDGRGDLAVGVPGEGVGSGKVGAVHVLYGGASGLSADGDQLWHQNSPGVLGTAEVGEFFGSALAPGDLNGDGRSDLAVGSHERLGAAVQAGAVNVLYGGASGLSADGNQFWHQNSPGVLDTAEDGDEFGGFAGTLAAGDLNADGRADLAVGVPFENVGGETDAGAVSVLYGTASGLSASGNQFWHQNSPGALGSAEYLDQLGRGLATGRFNGDGRADLAVGARAESVGSVSSAGAVNVLYGGASGLSADGDQLWHQNTPGVLDTAEDDDEFGFALAAGRFNGDGRADLAIGARAESVGSVFMAGAVNVLYGGASGLSADGDQLWHQNRPGVLETAEDSDGFFTPG